MSRIDDVDNWQARRKHEVEVESQRLSPIVWNNSHEAPVYYRPAELLMSSAAWALFGDRLRNDYGARSYSDIVELEGYRSWRGIIQTPGWADDDINKRLTDSGIDLQVYALLLESVVEVDLLELVAELRAEAPAGDPNVVVSVNHVLFAEQIYHGGPGDEPKPVGRPKLPGGPIPHGPDVQLAVLDTGVPLEFSQVHPELQGFIQFDPNDLDPLDETGEKMLDTCAAHGLFVSGLVYRLAPRLFVDPGRVLRAIGDGDDTGIAVELAETEAGVINLSLGGPTMDGEELPALASAIRKAVEAGKVVVAAAGNCGKHQKERKWWPAAMDEVIAVGAYDSTRTPLTRPDWTNRGTWVNVWAPGVNLVSAYVGPAVKPFRGPRFNGWASWSGTSFAAPLVAAEIALRAARSSSTPAEVAAELLAELYPAPWADSVPAKLYVPPIDLTQ